jgi:hypothetical protein
LRYDYFRHFRYFIRFPFGRNCSISVTLGRYATGRHRGGDKYGGIGLIYNKSGASGYDNFDDFWLIFDRRGLYFRV